MKADNMPPPTEKEIERRQRRALVLLLEAREIHAKMFDLLEEARKLLEGEQAVGDHLKHLIHVWCTAWQAVYGSPYAWGSEAAKNAGHLKRMLKALTPDDITKRITGYMHDRDAFVVGTRHHFGLFVTRLNRYTDAPRLSFQDGPSVDCLREGRHDPPCRSNADHTQKKMAEMRPAQ